MCYVVYVVFIINLPNIFKKQRKKVLTSWSMANYGIAIH